MRPIYFKDMNLFKLFFEHDMVLEQLQAPGEPVKPSKTSTLADFLKPTQTYSRFYLSSTDMSGPRFGLSTLPNYREFCYAVQIALEAKYFLRSDGATSDDLWSLLDGAPSDTAIVAVMNESFVCPLPGLSNRQGLREQVGDLLEVLDHGHLALYLEKAHHGTDIHVFSKSNVYSKLFYSFKSFIAPDFRFFSINAKRSRSERLFYFETWSLENPPHGFEEVFKETQL